MHARTIAGAVSSFAVLLPLFLPAASATRLSVSGTVTNCWSTTNCAFAFNTTTGTGWANATGDTISFQLPGGARATYNVSYSTSTALTTYLYPNPTTWTVGSFLGTDECTGCVVPGTTDTNYTADCHVVFKWCRDRYLTDHGTIIVHFTHAEATSTAVTCAATSILSGGRTVCRVKVANLWNSTNVPTGRITWSSGGG